MRRAIETTAAGSAAFGVAAVVTGASWAALLAGLTAVVTAGLVLRLVADAPTDETTAGTGRSNARVDGETDLSYDLGDSPRLLPAEMIEPALESHVVSARRGLRPVSIVIAELSVTTDEGDTARVTGDVVASAADVVLREADLVGRIDEGVYALLLDDTGEDGAVWTAERFRRHLVEVLGSVRFVAGVATYPVHALDATEMEGKARQAIDTAREWGRDRIEVAPHL